MSKITFSPFWFKKKSRRRECVLKKMACEIYAVPNECIFSFFLISIFFYYTCYVINWGGHVFSLVDVTSFSTVFGDSCENRISLLIVIHNYMDSKEFN